MKTVTSFSTQLFRLFNAPLDKNSVFESLNDFQDYLDGVSDESGNKYSGQLVVVKDSLNDGSNRAQLFVVYSRITDQGTEVFDKIRIVNEDDLINGIDISDKISEAKIEATVEDSQTIADLRAQVRDLQNIIDRMVAKYPID